MITACPNCQGQLHVPDDASGKRARCPRCQEVFAVSPPEATLAPPLPAAALVDEPSPVSAGQPRSPALDPYERREPSAKNDWDAEPARPRSAAFDFADAETPAYARYA